MNGPSLSPTGRFHGCKVESADSDSGFTTLIPRCTSIHLWLILFNRGFVAGKTPEEQKAAGENSPAASAQHSERSSQSDLTHLLFQTEKGTAVILPMRRLITKGTLAFK